jgi:hypothetical protein
MQFSEWKARDNAGSGGGMFLRLEAGKKYKVRLIYRPYDYLQHFTPVKARSPGKHIDPIVLKGLNEQNAPKSRHAIWVFNREEGNKLQVMDFPDQLYDEFVEWKNNFNDEPGGKTGPDWVLKVEKLGADKRNVKYKAMALDRTPFSEEELATIKTGINGVTLQNKLEEYRKPNTPEEILALLAAAESGESQPAASTAHTPAQTVAPSAPASAAAKPAAAPKKDEWDF